ncbi:putative tail length tape measure protein [Peptoniphilus duerdenii ATCC BAA-1640]|uniref:Putative tail length tape measure protein n=1 Tax=Peptoniphilus duerdenii ATCC BAA-1640 TaxID=862517 RepID=E0NN99_9FIRM|nr:tape measure protein [Peptoniphilus duerdenii]EFM24772.1 putative tail length tape measure protein [Peptoniphilus duerdenii ATCC BAA-1640]
MGVLESTIILKNQMSGVLNSIVDSMNMVISAAYDVETAGKKAFNPATLNGAKSKLAEVQATINKNAEEQEKFNRKLQEGSSAANKMAGMIKKALVTYASFRSVKAFVGLSDEMTQIKARLDAINDGHQTTLELQEMIYKSAQRARGEYKMTMDIVSKLGAQAKDAFASNEETIAFAENLNKLFTISGTSAQGVESVMYNLTQAMASGVLRGQDLNAVMANTPQLLRIVSEYMGEPIGKIRKLAEEGKLSADVIKNALLGASKEINEEFENMPMTFGQIAVSMKNRFLKNIEPALNRLNDFANSKAFQEFSDRALFYLGEVTKGIFTATEIAVKGMNFISDNLWLIEPAAVAAAAGFTAYTVATTAAKLATMELNLAMLKSPMFLIPAIITLIVAAYLKWANSVGGVGVAHLIVVNAIKNYMASLIINTRNDISDMIYQWQMYKVGIARMKNGVLDHLDNMRIKGLTILENMVNGAIGLINKLIDLVNKIPGVGIETIDQVSMVAGAKAEAARKKAERDQNLEMVVDQVERDKALRDSETKKIAFKYESEKFQREREIAKKQAEKLNAEKTEDKIPKFDIPKYAELPGIASDIGDLKKSAAGTKENTEKLKDGLEVKNEDISYLKDLMERRAIQNFSFDKLEVIANNNFGDVHETADLDGWMEGLTDKLTEAVEMTMGGIPQYE